MKHFISKRKYQENSMNTVLQSDGEMPILLRNGKKRDMKDYVALIAYKTLSMDMVINIK